MNVNEQCQRLLVPKEKSVLVLAYQNPHFPHNHTKWQNKALGQCNETACLVPESYLKGK